MIAAAPQAGTAQEVTQQAAKADTAETAEQVKTWQERCQNGSNFERAMLGEIADLRRVLGNIVSAPDEVRNAALAEGLEMAARHLDKQRQAVDQDHAYQQANPSLAILHDGVWYVPYVPPATQQAGSAVVGRDWIEDATHENGNYQCRCSTCGNTFIGHKRRITCKTCAATTASASGKTDCTDGGKCGVGGYCKDCPYAAPSWDHEEVTEGRATAPSQDAAPKVKTWQERMDDFPHLQMGASIAAKDAEIADLRAALAEQK